MFIINWFRPTKVTCNITPSQPTQNYVVQKEEYEMLLQRLRTLEAMMNALPMKPIIQNPTMPPPPPPMKKKVIEPIQTPFQAELEHKLRTIRTRMGESHGYGIDKLELENLDDLEKLEQSVMEQSTVLTDNDIASNKRLTDEIMNLIKTSD